jgi:hypothetical protein
VNPGYCWSDVSREEKIGKIGKKSKKNFRISNQVKPAKLSNFHSSSPNRLSIPELNPRIEKQE